MSDPCVHGRGRTVRCRLCEREGSSVATLGLPAGWLHGPDGDTDVTPRTLTPVWAAPPATTRLTLPVVPARAVSAFTERVIRERLVAVEAMLARSRAAALAHCRAPLADFPILRTDGQNPVEAVERIEVCCGACQAPLDGLLFSVRLQIGCEAAA